MFSLLSDLRYAIRSLRRSPGFFLIATLSLALALGLNTTMFGILDAVVHPYVPYPEPDRVFEIFRTGGGRGRRLDTQEAYAALRDGLRSSEKIAALMPGYGTIQAPASEEMGFIAAVSPNFFTMLGVRPYLGRTFTEADAAGDQAAAIPSFSAWRRLFGGRPSLEGATVTIDDHVYAVVGVMPLGMGEGRFDTQLWLVLPPSPDAIRARVPSLWGDVWPVVRLKRGVSIDAVKRELALVARRLTVQYGRDDDPYSYAVRPLRRGPLRLDSFDAAMGGAAIAVLLIACANLANLMLARGLARRRDLALRMALGATRGVIVREMVVESAVVALAGGALGMLASVWAMDVATHVMPPEVNLIGILAPHFSWRTFAFGLTATGLTVVLFGLLPALRSSDVTVSEPLKDSAGTTTGRTRHRYSALVIAEVALSLVLLMSAGLLMRAAVRVSDFQFGYDARHLLRTTVRFRPDRLPPDTEWSRVLDHVTERLRLVDGVRMAASFAWQAIPGNQIISDAPVGPGGRIFVRGYRRVSPDFLRTLGIPIVAGRDFVDGDRSSAGVVIVDQRAAKLLWPDGRAVGRLVKLGNEEADLPWLRVIGVAREVRLGFSGDPYLTPEPVVYVVQPATRERMRQYIVRVSGEGRAARMASTALRREARGAAPGAVVDSFTPWLSSFDDVLAGHRFFAGLFAVLGAFALLLAAVGLYGVLAYAVGQRMREFGVRLALGAQPRDLVALVARDGLVMVLGAIGVGALFAMWAAKLLSTWLYTVSPTDVVSLVTAECLLFAVSMAACAVPALQAARATPLDVLRAS